LWRELHRPNVFIKVPATAEGVPAIRQLIGEGINVNVTLLFGLPRYREVAEAYISGLEARVAGGKPVGTVASVASFFLSRIDTLVDPMLEACVAKNAGGAAAAKAALGQVAVASARSAYQIYKQMFHGGRFRKLAAHGARPQRLLWASTSAKNPNYGDLSYVEPIIGPETVNTVTSATLDAYRDHGNPAVRVEADLPRAANVMNQLPALGIDIDRVTMQLEDEGVEKFNTAFDRLLAAVNEKCNAGP
jgi:transaldolase